MGAEIRKYRSRGGYHPPAAEGGTLPPGGRWIQCRPHLGGIEDGRGMQEIMFDMVKCQGLLMIHIVLGLIHILHH